MQNKHLKNLAIIAHVDHGKTTLIDQLLQQSGVYNNHETVVERVMDSGELEKEKGITIRAKNCAIHWKGVKVNLLDTPGHADFGGEVERSLLMVDGVLILVDAAEGPLPQTRFVLTKALEQNIKVAVVINKIDRPDARIDEVRKEIEDLILDLVTFLNIDNFDIDLPFFYASAKNGYGSADQTKMDGNLHPILDFITSDYFPSPKISSGEDFQLVVNNLAYSNYLGVLVIGENNKTRNFKATSVQIYEGLKQQPVAKVEAGEIVILAGLEAAQIGDTICSFEKIDPLPRIIVSPPTVSVHVSVSTSPMSGKDGEYLTSRKLEELLDYTVKNNISLQYSPTEDPKCFELKARGELQLAIVFEEIRRKGYEFMVSRPQVLVKEINGETHEPYERVVIDIPSNSTGSITEILSKRKGIMESMVPLGHDRTRMEFCVPARGLIGLRSTFLTETRGEGLMSSYFLDYRPWAGKMLGRTNGALISDRAGKTTMYALYNLLSSGKQFVNVGDYVYEGMVVGEHTRVNELNVLEPPVKMKI